MPPKGIPSYRPPFMGTHHMVSSGHWLASVAGLRILQEGGNAIDAGVASGIALNGYPPQPDQLRRSGPHRPLPCRCRRGGDDQRAWALAQGR